MIYAMGAIRRRPDLSLDDFTHYWETTHRDLVLEFARPGPIEGYIQNQRLPDLPGELESDFDGVPELWIRDAAGLGELGASDRFQYISDQDSANFIDMPPLAFLASAPQFSRGRPRTELFGKIRLIQFVKRPVGSAAATFDAAWTNQGTPLEMPDGTPLRLTRQAVLPPEREVLHPSGFFGFESSWWPDLATLMNAWAGRKPLAGSTSLAAREVIALEPPEE